jgi:hypothetical protein
VCCWVVEYCAQSVVVCRCVYAQSIAVLGELHLVQVLCVCSQKRVQGCVGGKHAHMHEGTAGVLLADRLGCMV